MLRISSCFRLCLNCFLLRSINKELKIIQVKTFDYRAKKEYLARLETNTQTENLMTKNKEVNLNKEPRKSRTFEEKTRNVKLAGLQHRGTVPEKEMENLSSLIGTSMKAETRRLSVVNQKNETELPEIKEPRSSQRRRTSIFQMITNTNQKKNNQTFFQRKSIEKKPKGLYKMHTTNVGQ